MEVDAVKEAATIRKCVLQIMRRLEGDDAYADVFALAETICMAAWKIQKGSDEAPAIMRNAYPEDEAGGGSGGR